MKHKAQNGSSVGLLDRFEVSISARMKRSRPRQYRQLMESGNLIEHLKQQAKLAVSLMGPSVEAGADESAALEFAWPLLYPEPEKSPPEQNGLPGSISFEYDQAATLLLQASRQRGSLFKIEQALHIAAFKLAEKRGIAKDNAAAWILGRTLRFLELQAREPTMRVKSVVGFLKGGCEEEADEQAWNRSQRP
jgi:hypothetical protein